MMRFVEKLLPVDEMEVAEFCSNSATCVGSAVASTRRRSGDNGYFWQSLHRCILPQWMFLIIGRLTRFSVC